jgi:hypothetical protein
MLIASAKHDWEDYEITEFQSAREVCAESATCPNLEGFYFLEDENNQIIWGKTHVRTEVTLELDVSSGTYQVSQYTEKITFVDIQFD